MVRHYATDIRPGGCFDLITDVRGKLTVRLVWSTGLGSGRLMLELGSGVQWVRRNPNLMMS